MCKEVHEYYRSHKIVSFLKSNNIDHFFDKMHVFRNKLLPQNQTYSWILVYEFQGRIAFEYKNMFKIFWVDYNKCNILKTQQLYIQRAENLLIC